MSERMGQPEPIGQVSDFPISPIEATFPKSVEDLSHQTQRPIGLVFEDPTPDEYIPDLHFLID